MKHDLLRSPRPWRLLALLCALLLAATPLLPMLLSIFDFRDGWQLGDPRLRQLFLRTLWMSAASAVVAVALGLPLALLAQRTRVLGAPLLLLLMPLPLFLPPLLIAQAWNGLTGMDGQMASWLTLGLCYAPLPALLAARALSRQQASAHEAALLCGGPGLALREMLRVCVPAAAFGGGLAFLFASTDFAVPDYFASIGDKFAVYPAEIFNRWRDQDYLAGARAAGPLVLLGAGVLYGSLVLRDRWSAPLAGSGRNPAALPLGRAAAPLAILAWSLTALLLLLPVGRILYETGMAGAAAEGSWVSRSGAAFGDALARGREDLGRSLRTGVLAGGVALLLAPFLADALARARGRRARLMQLALALPLLAPAVGTGLGAISVSNRALFGDLYQSTALVVMVMAGRFLPIAVFLLAERFQRVPRNQWAAAELAGLSYPLRVWRVLIGPHRAAWWLAGGLVVVFVVRELDLAILLPDANSSAAVRYFNALHFARDNFVAAFGLLMALILFLPMMLYVAWTSLRSPRQP